MATLSGRYVSKGNDIRNVDGLIKHFFKTFDQCYSSSEGFIWKMNLHLLEHLPRMVQLYGPLPVQSAYFTENTMRIISRRVKSGKNVSQQVCKKIVNHQATVSFCSSNVHNCSIDFLGQMAELFPKLVPNGSIDEVSISSEVDKIRVNGTIICTKKYNQSKAKTTCNHCIKTFKNKFFLVSRIIRDGSQWKLDCNELAKVKKYEIGNEPSSSFNHVFTFSKVSDTNYAYPFI